MPLNEQILKERYADIRIRIKKCKNGSLEKRALKRDLNTLLKHVEESFGREAVVFLVKKKYE